MTKLQKNKIRNALKEVASVGDVITYGDLISQLGLDLDLERIDHRNELSAALGEISEAEVKAGRPMLSSVVVKDGNGARTKPGDGFFELADGLGLRQAGQSNDEVFLEQLGTTHGTWATIRKDRKKFAKA
jgi:hypothetical protein